MGRTVMFETRMRSVGFRLPVAGLPARSNALMFTVLYILALARAAMIRVAVIFFFRHLPILLFSPSLRLPTGSEFPIRTSDSRILRFSCPRHNEFATSKRLRPAEMQ